MSEKWNREKCQETGVQNCYYCETYDCCNNNTPPSTERPERTCEVTKTSVMHCHGWETYWNHTLSCGHTICTFGEWPPVYCPHCGAKVVEK